MRATRDLISDRRRSRQVTILLTGGTGFLGSHLAVEFIKRGYPVVLVCRTNRHASASQRVDRLLEWFGLARDTISHLEIIEGDLAEPNLGLSTSHYTYLLEAVDEIVHCAGNTSFSERKRGEVEKDNLKALEYVLKLAADGRCSYFHHVSTAYVAGKRSGVCEEALVETERFNNVYEETKNRAEHLVSEVCGEKGIRMNIYRPSIVYGNSKTGRSLAFNALYYPIKALLFLKDLYKKDIQQQGGEKADKMGIRAGNDGSLYMPIRIEEKKAGRIDLIPIDYFVESFMTLMEGCPDSAIFHIVAHRPSSLEEILHYTRDLFFIKGIATVGREELERAPKNALEMLYDGYLQTYHPYIRDTRTFSNERAESILKKRHIRCPDFTFSVFSRCMKYAVEVDWGRKLSTI
jgi:nucleoside-diphosphate-sugar epimerase